MRTDIIYSFHTGYIYTLIINLAWLVVQHLSSLGDSVNFTVILCIYVLALVISYCVHNLLSHFETSDHYVYTYISILILECPHSDFLKITPSFIKSDSSNSDAVFYCKGCIIQYRFGFPNHIIDSGQQPTLTSSN